MGAWGTAISSNDTFKDIYDSFFELYNNDESVKNISEKLIAENQEIINDPDDTNNFWFALAKAKWECKQLDNSLLDKVKVIVEKGLDLEVWKRLNANEKDIQKRKIVLDKFLALIQTERLKAKSRKKRIIRHPPFEKGECLTFKLANGNYGGAVVLEAIRDTEYGYCLIAPTRINQVAKPTKSDFENAEILILNYGNWEEKSAVNWYFSIRHKEKAHLIERIDITEVQISYEVNNTTRGFVGDFDLWIIQVANEQFKSEEIKSRPTVRQTLKELAKKKNNWKP